MDIVGQLTKPVRCNRYLFVVVDYYTRWPEAYAIVHQYAHSISSKLLTKYFVYDTALYTVYTLIKGQTFNLT